MFTILVAELYLYETKKQFRNVAAIYIKKKHTLQINHASTV